MENMENIYFKLVTIISVENERSVSLLFGGLTFITMTIKQEDIEDEE